MDSQSNNRGAFSLPQLDYSEPPMNSDRRSFMVRSAMASAIGLLGGQVNPLFAQAAAEPPLQGKENPDLNVVKQSKGPVMTLVDEFYKVGPGPSSSHTIGPMRITYDFYQRAIKLPQAQLDQATALKVHLYGSLSATGKGHGTERAALAGLIGHEPATIDPVAVLDKMATEPNKTYPVKLGTKTINASLADIIYDAPKGDFPHANTMTAKLMAGDKVLLEQEYYSVGGGFIEWKGYTPPKKNPPKYPYETMKEIIAYTTRDNISIAQLAMANETSISGRSEAEINAFLDKIIGAMRTTVKTGLAAPTATLPGPIKLKTKARDVYQNAMKETNQARRGIGVVSAAALAGSEENARGHLVITAPTGGSAGVMPAVLYSLDEGAKVSQQKLREGLLAAAVVGYLCKHHATLAAAEGGCQAEIGVASAMGAAMIAQAQDAPPQVAANAAEGALEHHLGMTCDPVAGFVQIPCIERCAFGAVKSWTGYLIAKNEIPSNRRVDFDSTVQALAITAKEMNGKYKETSEGGLAVSLTLC
jgi:L-serine dehydratase